MATMAKKVSGLTFKGRSFYSRISVPTALQPLYGKKELSAALGRVSHSQAEVKHRELEAHYAALFQTQLHELGIEPTAPMAPAVPKRLPSAPELAFVAKEGARALLATDEVMRSQGAYSVAYDAWAAVLSDLDADVTAGLAGMNMGQLFKRFEADLHSHGLKAPQDLEELRPMVYKWATAYGHALKQIQQRVQGAPVDTPEPAAEPESLKAHKMATPVVSKDPGKKTAEQLKLRDIFELWRDHETKRPSKTVSIAELAVRRFEAHTKNPAIGTLTRAQGAEYRKQLMGDAKLTVGMASAQLVWMNIFLNFELDNYQRITVNPWAGLGITNSTTTSRDEWKDPQVVQLFDSPLFKAYELPTVDRAGLDAAYWVPLIGAYTGARISEIAQLLVADIKEVDGVQCYQIAVTDDEWQSIKVESSKRVIPVHSELVRLGFLDYVRDMAALGAVRVFPALVVSENNGAGGGISKWFSEYKTAAGFGPANVFHAWRNTVETKLQRSREGQLYIDRYLGHKPEGMGAGTYARVQPSDLVGTASKVTYDGLRLERVYKAPKWSPGFTPKAARGKSGKTAKRL